jgi:hypothetical protein
MRNFLFFRLLIKDYNNILRNNKPCLNLSDLCETSVFLCVTNNYTECRGGFADYHREKITVMETNKIAKKTVRL